MHNAYMFYICFLVANDSLRSWAAQLINLIAAKAIGLLIPEPFLLRTDEVIERGGNVRYWHLADINDPRINVRFRG